MMKRQHMIGRVGEWANGRFVIPLFAALLFIAFNVYAGGPGTTTGELLKIPVGARAIGMGEATTAATDDSSSLQSNPAGLSFAAQKEAAFMHSTLLEGVHYEHLSYASPGDNYSYGFSLSYLGYGDIAGYDNSGNATGDVSASAYNLSGGMSTMIHDRISLGLTGTFLRQKLAEDSAATVAFNAGAIYSAMSHPLRGDYRFGMSLLNVGPGLKFVSERDPLPRKLKLGAAAIHVKEWPVTFTADLTIPNDNSAYIGLGSEYWFKELIALRLGYAGSNDEGRGVRLGLGLKLREFLFDYAYGGFGDFGATHRVGMAFRFGEKVRQLNKGERNILKDAKAARQQGDYVQAILGMDELLQKDPTNDHILKEMIRTHEAMLNNELNEAVAQTNTKDEVPSPEEFALQDLVPGQQSVARGFNPQDPLELNKLPDASNMDLSPIHVQMPTGAAAPVVEPNATLPDIDTPMDAVQTAPPPPPADLSTINPASQPDSSARPAASASDDSKVMLNPADIYGN